MLDLDGSDPEPEAGQLSSKDLDEFRSEAVRFQKRRATEGTKQNSHILLLLIAAVLLFGFIGAAVWALVQSYQ